MYNVIILTMGVSEGLSSTSSIEELSVMQTMSYYMY
jgi:hypothetical protein